MDWHYRRSRTRAVEQPYCTQSKRYRRQDGVVATRQAIEHGVAAVLRDEFAQLLLQCETVISNMK